MSDAVRPGRPFETPVPLPPIPGLAFRHFRDRSDYGAMNDVANAVRLAESAEWSTSLDGFVNFYEHLPRTQLDRDVLVVEVAGQIVAYGRTEIRDLPDGSRILELVCFIHPKWWRQGIGTAMLATLEAHVRTLDAAAPTTRPRFLEVDGPSASAGREALYRAFEYAPVRSGFTMLRPDLDDVPEARLPIGLEVREVRPEHMRAIWEAEAEAFLDEWGHAEATEAEFEQFLGEPLNDATLWRVAWDGEQVAGVVRAFINEAENEARGLSRAWIGAVSVRRPWRRRGLATALIAASFPALRRRAMTEALLGVDTENPSGALRIYERLGFRPLTAETVWRKPLA